MCLETVLGQKRKIRLLEQTNPTISNLINNPRTFMRCDDIHPRHHAKFLDKTLGYKIPKIEVKLQQKYRDYYRDNDETNKKQHFEGTQTWIGLHPQVLQTPYNDIFDALYLLKDFDIQRIVDIGAGYGRVGVVMNAIFPMARFIGFEVVKQRKNEANRVFERLNLINCEVLQKNVLEEDFILPKAQVYFIYDFSEMNDISIILDMLVERKNDYNFFLITKGERVDYLLKKKYKDLWQTNGYLSSGELNIYSSITNLNNFKHRSF